MGRSFFQCEGDSSAAFINVDDADFEFVSYLADIARFLVVVVGHFVNVEKTGEAVIQFYDNAEFKDLNDLGIHNVIYFMIMDSCFPGIGEAILVAEGDSLFFTIEGFDFDINFLFRFENIFDLGNLFPGNIGNMEKAFYAVDTNECAVRHNLLYSAFENVAVFISFFDNIHFCISFIFQNGFAGKNQSVLSAVHFQNLSLESLAYQVLQGMNEAEIALGQGDESAERFNLNKQTNLNGFNAFAFNGFTFFECFFDYIPVSETVYFNLRYVNCAIFFNSPIFSTSFRDAGAG